MLCAPTPHSSINIFRFETDENDNCRGKQEMFFVRFIELAQQSHISDLRHVKSLITNQFSPHLNLSWKEGNSLLPYSRMQNDVMGERGKNGRNFQFVSSGCYDDDEVEAIRKQTLPLAKLKLETHIRSHVPRLRWKFYIFTKWNRIFTKLYWSHETRMSV